MKISACLIVKNEAENIRRCLDSISGVSDEIILVDTGSDDNTVEIALNYGAKVYNYQWDNNFSNARNFSINKATGDWIICLDADQYLEENTQKNLKPALIRIDNNMNIDSVICKEISTNGFNGKFITEIPTIRIFRGNCKIRYKGAIHEKPLNDGEPLNPVNLSDISLIIYHTGYTSDELITKAERNLKILKQLVDNNTKDNLTYYYISVSYNNLNNHEEAIKYALLALDEPNFNGTILAHQPYTILIHNMLKLKDKYLDGDIEKYVDMATNLFPTHPEVWYSRAQVKTEQKNYPAAIESYLKAIECNKNFKLLMTNDFPAFLENVYYSLAILFNETGDQQQALEYYYDTLNINKHNIKALAGVYDLIKEQQPAEILFFLNGIYDKSNKDDLIFINNAMDELGNAVLANYYYNLYETL